MNEWFSKIMIWMLLMGFMPSVSFSDEVAGGEDLKMNQIQVVGTHNSYHLMPGNNSTLKANTGQKVYPWAYSHLPLDQQLTNAHLQLAKYVCSSARRCCLVSMPPPKPVNLPFAPITL